MKIKVMNSEINLIRLFEYIQDECKKFYELTDNDVDLRDVIFTYGNRTMMLVDWDEGKDNDPFWDEELNQHSAISFIYKMVKLIEDYYND